MRFTMIVPFSNQNESRLPAFYNLLNSIKAQDIKNIEPFEFILVEHKTSKDYKVVDDKGIPDKHIVVEHESAFNKSWCMNVAAKEAKGDWLIYVDADMLFGKEYIYKVNLWREGTIPTEKFFVGWDSIIKMPGPSEPIARVVTPACLTAGGIFWVKRNFYWEVGGMNENYFGYGAEDNDFWIRVNTTIGKNTVRNVRYAPYPLAHIYHDDAVPSPERFYHLDRVHQFPNEIIKKLREAELGNKNHPTTIDVSQLQLYKVGLQDPKSGGII